MIKIPRLTNSNKQSRLRFARWWRQTKGGRLKNKNFLFSEEKIFSVDGSLKKQNFRVYAISREAAYFNGSKYILRSTLEYNLHSELTLVIFFNEIQVYLKI